MKMEGDPHVTAWGVMRGQALDLITPQQVVGGLFLMNAEEKACMALQGRLEILDEQAELMSAPHPLLSQHDEGAGAGQGAGHCQSRPATAKPWTGEEDGRLTLCTLNLLPQSPIYKPSTDDQMPPLIIVPSENAHLPLCPAPFGQEHGLEVDIPYRDHPPSADYFLDVRSLLIPDRKSDRDDLVSALDSHLVPVPVDLEQMLPFTSDARQGSQVPLASDQIIPLESCLPFKIDQSCSFGPLLDPDVELLTHCDANHSLPWLEPSLEQLPQSETLVDLLVTESETLVDLQVTESETLVDLQVTESETLVDLQATESETLVDLQVTESETLVDLQVTESETLEDLQVTEFEKLVDLQVTESETLGALQVTESETLGALQVTESETLGALQVTESETLGDLQVTEYETLGDLQVTKSEMLVDAQVTETEQLPQTETLGDFEVTETKQLLQSETVEDVQVTETEQLPQTETLGDGEVTETKQLLQSETVEDVQVTETEQLPQTETLGDGEVTKTEQLLQSETVEDVQVTETEQLPQTETLGDGEVTETEQLLQSETVEDVQVTETEQLPQTVTLGDGEVTKTEQLLQSETVEDVHVTETEQLPQTETLGDGEVTETKQLLQSETVVDVQVTETEQLPQTETLGDGEVTETEQLLQSETVEDVQVTETEQLPQTVTLGDGEVTKTEQLLQSETVEDVQVTETEQLPQTETLGDGEVTETEQLPQTETLGDGEVTETEQLLQSETVVNVQVTKTEQSPQSETVVDMQVTETEQMAHLESDMVAVVEQLPCSESFHLSQGVPSLVPNPSESDVEPDPKQLPLTKSFVDTQIYSCLVPDPAQLPKSESDLDPKLLSMSIVYSKELSHLYIDPDSESFVVTEELLQSISHLDPEKMAQSEPYFDPMTDSLPQSETESCLIPHYEIPHSFETYLDPCVNTVELESLPSSEIPVTFNVFPTSESCLEPNTGPLTFYDQIFNYKTLPHFQPLQDCDVGLLAHSCPEITQAKACLNTNELYESELDPHIDQSHHCLDSDVETFSLAESFMAHDTEQSIESLPSLVPTTDQLTHSALLLDSNLRELNPEKVHLEQELPHLEDDEVPSSDPLSHLELSLNIDQIPNTGSVLDHDPDQFPWFERSMCSSALPFSTHILKEGESSMAYEADELSLCDPFLAPDHYELFASKSTTSSIDRLTLDETYLEPGARQPCESSSDVDHEPPPGPFMVPTLTTIHQSEAFLTPDTEHLLHSKCMLDHNTDRLTESCLDNDQLPKIEILLDSDHVPVSAPYGTIDFERLPGLESNLVNSVDQLQLNVSSGAPVTDQLPLIESFVELDGSRPELEPCLTSDDDLFFLSETFLGHDVDQIAALDHSMTPETNHLASFELCLKPEDAQTEPWRPVNNDRLPQPETCKSPHNDQLTLTDSDELTLSECPLSPDSDPLPKSCSDPSMNMLNESCMHPENKLPQCECPLSPDDELAQTKPCLNANNDPLTRVELESCLMSKCDQLPQLESCMCQENEQLPQYEWTLSPDDYRLSPSDACLGSDNDPMSHFEFPLYPSNDQLSQTKPHLVPNGDFMAQLETHLGFESDEMSRCESHSEHPRLVPHSDLITQYGFFSRPECLQAPNTTQPTVFESTGIPDQIHVAPSCPSTDVLSLAPNADPLCSIEFPLVESSLTSDTEHLPSSDSYVMPNLDMPHLTQPTGEMPLSKSSFAPSIDHFDLLETSVQPSTTQLLLLEPSLPHSTVSLSLFDQLDISEPSASPTTPHFPPSECPGTPNSTSVPLRDSSIMLNTPSNTNLPSSTPEEFQFCWDWTLNWHPSEMSLCNEPPQTSAKQTDDPEDCFSIFRLDTPLDCSHMTPAPDLTLSDDLLSLCDVFSDLQTNDILQSHNDQSPISTNGQTDYDVEGDQLLDTIFQKELESDPPSTHYTLHNESLSPDCGILNSDSDLLDSYCLDLLFEPSRIHHELETLSNETLLQPNPRACAESVVDLTNSTDPSLLFSESQICTVGLPFMEKSLTSNNLDDSLVSCSDSPLTSSRICQSNSQLVIEVGSSHFEPLGESTQLPVIVVTDSLELLSNFDHMDNILATKASPLDIFTSTELETDAHLHVVEVPSCEVEDLPELKPDMSEVNRLTTDCPDSSDLSLYDGPALSDQPQSDSIVGTTLPSFISTGELPLTCTGSPFEGIKLRSRDSQDPASTLLHFGDGDPFLAFTLDNDSPCAGDELARLRAVFDALDRDKDGFVKMEDFVQFATVYGAEQVKYLTGYLDPAGLGVINFRDFYRGISEIQNEDLDMQLYDMGYPSEEEPACSVDFDDLAAFEVTEVTDSAYVGSESAYSECETFTDEDTGGLAAQEDQENEGDGAGSRGHAPATPEGLELSLSDISGVNVTGQEEQFEDFGEGAEPDLFNSHCEEEQESFTQTTISSQRLTSSGAPVSERQLLAPPPCTGLGGLYCSQCHKHINRLEDLSSRLRYLEMDSPDKRTSTRKEARRLHHSGYLEDQGEQPLTNMACDNTDLTDKVLYLEQRVCELERDAAMTGEQQNRLKQENLHLLHRAHALEEQLKDQEVRSDEVQSEETRKHRDELRKMERDRGFRLSSLKARLQELENENVELRSQLPSAKATTQRLEEEKLKLLDQVEELQHQLKEHQEQNKMLGGKLSKERHKQQTEKERCQEVIEELRRELEQTQLLRLEMEQRMGLGNSAALQEYNSRTKEAELEHEVRRLKQEQRLLKDQNEELNGQIINLSIQGAKNLFSTTFSDSLAAEISNVSRDELMEAIQKQEEINLRLQDYIDRIIVAIMETNPAILEVKIH